MDPQAVDLLVQAVVAGDAGAWQRLVQLLCPRIEAIASGHDELRSRQLNGNQDDVADIRTASLERLSRRHHHNLVRYLEQRERRGEQAQSFDSWLYGAVDFVIRDHLRKRFGRAPKKREGGSPQPGKRDLNSQARRLDAEPLDRALLDTIGMTTRLTLAEIFAVIDRDFQALESQALQLYYAQERSFAEIAQTLRLASERDAEKLIRRLNARLRYRFMERA